MNIEDLEEPPFEPISLEDARIQCRVDPYEGSPPAHPDDDLILRAITAAREHVEGVLRRRLVQRAVRITTDRLPSFRVRMSSRWGQEDDYICRPGWLELRAMPLVRVESVRYYDENNQLQTVDPSAYFVVDEKVPRLQFKESFNVPCTYDRADAVRIDVVAGYPTDGSPADTQQAYAAKIPKSIINAMLLLIADQYENREGQFLGTIRADNPTLKALLRNHIVLSF